MLQPGPCLQSLCFYQDGSRLSPFAHQRRVAGCPDGTLKFCTLSYCLTDQEGKTNTKEKGTKAGSSVTRGANSLTCAPDDNPPLRS